ncbi:hypothetical protein H2202_007627 [Exophiala xenobiotica]|nr:hypothetical protein H2202_007627 [Exophiala xenobiotica]KAK5236364.1 hypothetical protein LTR47_002315 [Exophiala xenobiotica]KAK5248888.1 hypothetical protein LTS06_006187 [Exophiala xenobiotica]KAK5258400.1 hypothetical protein LTR40_007966 [Exophiala xenobiotica]KAK5350475.1 hypothetical protein LTR61_005672 [Exophiala xenobiotica]
MSERVKQVAVEEAERVKAMTTEAVQSRAYLYPFKGIFYFVSHKDLWRPLISRLAPTITLSIGVTTFMFLVAYVPQAAVMAFTSGPIAAISAALLTLSESSTLINLLSRTFLIEEAIIDTFDGTLLSRDCTNLVQEGRQISASGDNIARLGKMLKTPFAKFTPNAIVRYLLYLPLNFIPVVGTIIFILLQGKRAGPAAHTRYFQLKEWSKRQRDVHVEEHRGGYTSFGVAAFVLEMIPFANLVFAFTNTVGAALWAADLEKNTGTSPNVRELAKKAE